VPESRAGAEVVSRRYLVRGRVQGVGFRWHTRAEAQELALAGWVRNLPDGRVELQARGPEPRMALLEAFLREGPPLARVDELVVEELGEDEALEEPFEVRR